MLAFIMVGSTPYWNAFFVAEQVTWPYHLVMLFSILAFLGTLFLYILFVSGQHLECAHIAWPTVVSIIISQNLAVFTVMVCISSQIRVPLNVV